MNFSPNHFTQHKVEVTEAPFMKDIEAALRLLSALSM